MILSGKVLMPDNSYTYISKAWHTTSWLEHCICTADAHDTQDAMEINYDLATTDHITLFYVVKFMQYTYVIIC